MINFQNFRRMEKLTMWFANLTAQIGVMANAHGITIIKNIVLMEETVTRQDYMEETITTQTGI